MLTDLNFDLILSFFDKLSRITVHAQVKDKSKVDDSPNGVSRKGDELPSLVSRKAFPSPTLGFVLFLCFSN